MSRWTHIAGIVRYDDLMRNKSEAFREMKRIEHEYFTFAPHGSEGPMDYTILPTHEYEQDGNVTMHGSGLCDIAFSGDFRDFHENGDGSEYDGSWKQLEEWFEKITKDEGLDTRQAVLLIEDDYGKQKILTYKQEEV